MLEHSARASRDLQDVINQTAPRYRERRVVLEPLVCEGSAGWRSLCHYRRGVAVKGIGPHGQGEEIGIVHLQVFHVSHPLVNEQMVGAVAVTGNSEDRPTKS